MSDVEDKPRTTYRSLRGSVLLGGPTTIPWYKFVFVIYFCVCGGAFGYEEAVGNAGPALTLLMTMLIPLVWCLPLAYITAELGTMYPESNEGVFIWIRHGLGPAGEMLSFAAAVVYYLTYVVDLALYSTLFYSYFQYFAESVFTGDLSYYLVIVTLIVTVTVITLLGVDLIGSISTFVAIGVMLPFLITLVWGGAAGFINPARDWVAPPPGPYGNWTWSDASSPAALTRINSGFHVCIWSLSGYDALGQLRDPTRTFGRSLSGAIVLSFLTYSTAVVGLLGAPAPNSSVPNFADWKAGYFSQAAAALGGPGLRIVIVAAGLLSCFGTFQALMMPVSEQLVELCGKDLLDVPFFRWKLQRFNTPWTAILFNAAITFAFSFVNFESLVDALNLLHSTVLILVCVSFVSLRYSTAGRAVMRPFRAVPYDCLAPALVFFPLCICIWLVAGIVWLKTFWAAVGAVALYAIGICMFFGCRHRKRKGWMYASLPNGSPGESDALIQN